MNLDRDTRRTFIIIAATLAVLLLIGIVFSGRPGDAIYTGPPVSADRLAEVTPPAAEPVVEEEVEVVEEAAEPEPVEAEVEVVEEAAEPEPVEEPTVAIAGDPEAGAAVFRACQACHMIGEGAQNRVGPLLTGVVDQPAAAVEGFGYSAAMQARGDEGLVWTAENLRAFLADPRGFVPGTSMAYAGVRSESDLENLIAYLASYE